MRWLYVRLQRVHLRPSNHSLSSMQLASGVLGENDYNLIQCWISMTNEGTPALHE